MGFNNMYYYEVWVRSSRYHGSTPLTYSSKQKLARGSLVEVQMQAETVLGFISGSVSPPRFKTKAVSSVLDLPPLPAHTLKLAIWLKDYYPAALGILTQQFLPAQLPQKTVDKATGSRATG